MGQLLVVEDNPLLLVLYQAVATEVSVDLQAVTVGQEALDLIQDGATFDLIIMDFNLPDMDGREVTRLLRSAGVSCPIIAVSTAAEIERQPLESVGFDEGLLKPLQLPELEALLRRYLK